MLQGSTGSKFHNMKTSMFWKGGTAFPKLETKAGECRYFGPALLAVFELYYDRGIWEQRKIRLALMMSCRIEAILDAYAEAYKLPGGVATEFLHVMYTMNCLITELGNHFQSQVPPVELFNFTIKNHYTLHIAEMAAYINPRIGWCYQGEDFVGTLTKLIATCIKSLPPHLVVNKAMQKYCLGISGLLRESPE